MTQVVTSAAMLQNVTVLNQLLEDKKKWNQKGIAAERLVATNIAYEIIFGIFDKKGNCFGGDAVGSAAKAVLRAKNGDKPVKARTVTIDMIGGCSVDEMQAALSAWKVKREADLALRAATMKNAHARVDGEVRPVYTDAEIKIDIDSKLADAAKQYEAAQEYVNVYWPQIPSAMKLINCAGNGTVRTSDGEIKPVTLAFEMVLLNRAETAKQFAKVVVKTLPTKK